MALDKAPLIEPDPTAPGHSLVTYVFPLPEGANYVVLSPGFGEAKDNVLDHASPSTRGRLSRDLSPAETTCAPPTASWPIRR